MKRKRSDGAARPKKGNDRELMHPEIRSAETVGESGNRP